MRQLESHWQSPRLVGQRSGRARRPHGTPYAQARSTACGVAAGRCKGGRGSAAPRTCRKDLRRSGPNGRLHLQRPRIKLSGGAKQSGGQNSRVVKTVGPESGGQNSRVVKTVGRGPEMHLQHHAVHEGIPGRRAADMRRVPEDSTRISRASRRTRSGAKLES